MKHLLFAVPLLLGAAPPTQPPTQALSLAVSDLRSQKGRLLVCITRSADHFPDCTADPDKRHMAVDIPVTAAPLGSLPPGVYAIAIVHDENNNGKLDTFMGIPREGVGFSRNPVVRFGAPHFRSASFTIAGAAVRQDIRVKYFL